MHSPITQLGGHKGADISDLVSNITSTGVGVRVCVHVDSWCWSVVLCGGSATATEVSPGWDICIASGSLGPC